MIATHQNTFNVHLTHPSLRTRIFFILISACLWALMVCAETNEGYANQSESSTRPPSGEESVGQVFISVIYPLSKLDQNSIELIPRIEGAFTFSGKSFMEGFSSFSYFPAPLSYPFRFTENGIQKLKHVFSTLPVIDKKSITVKLFPNVSKGELPSNALKEILVNEKYLYFKLREWSNVYFMRFPTFLVVNFDYSSTENSYDDYRVIAAECRKKINDLANMEDFKNRMGIKRDKGVTIPNLVFVSFSSTFENYWGTANFRNRYFSSTGNPDLFMHEISFRQIEDAKRLFFTPDVTYCYSIVSERNFLGWRFYYNFDEPLFLLRETGIWQSHDIGKYGGRNTFNRVLRVALFVNVTLPHALDWAKRVDTKIAYMLASLQSERHNLFDTFSKDSLSKSHADLREKDKVLQELMVEAHRVEEVQNGCRMLQEFMKDPFHDSFQLGRPVDPVPDSHICLDVYDFRAVGNYVNDRTKYFDFTDNISHLINSIKQNSESFLAEFPKVRDLLESRRAFIENQSLSETSLFESRKQHEKNLAESQRNVLLAIAFPAAGGLVGVLFLAGLSWFSGWVKKKYNRLQPLFISGFVLIAVILYCFFLLNR